MNMSLVLDPPRKGLHANTTNIILKRLPRKIAYLSCNPITLSRDIKYFLDSKEYILEQLYPIDFFPQTTHLECLALLSKTNF